MRRERRSDERGLATITGLMVVGVLTFVAVACAFGGTAITAQRRAQSGADLVALAAAGSVQRGGDGCSVADRYAIENKVVLDRCVVQGDQVTIVVHARVMVTGPLDLTMPARARAGPG